MSLLLGGLCWLLFYGIGTWPALFLPTRTAWTYVMAFTLGLGLVNLLPILPLDGGNVLRNTLSLHPRWDSELIAIVTGLVLCLILLGLAVRDQVYWDVLIILLLARENIHLLIHRRDHRLDDQLDDINEKLQHGEPREALQDALAILEQARSQAYKRWAFRTVAFLYVYLEDWSALPALTARYPAFAERTPELDIGTALASGRHDEALARAEETYDRHPEAWLAILRVKLLLRYRGAEPAWVFLQQVQPQAFYPAVADHVAELFLRQGGETYAFDLSEALFRTQGDPRHAYNAACALQGRPEEAMTWLRRALDAGFDDPELVQTDPDLDSLRTRTDFPSV
jgi:hypothetical protein